MKNQPLNHPDISFPRQRSPPGRIPATGLFSQEISFLQDRFDFEMLYEFTE
jgi:hypothetical protein